jgi:hypothetical protein
MLSIFRYFYNNFILDFILNLKLLVLRYKSYCAEKVIERNAPEIPIYISETAEDKALIDAIDKAAYGDFFTSMAYRVVEESLTLKLKSYTLMEEAATLEELNSTASQIPTVINDAQKLRYIENYLGVPKNKVTVRPW